MCARSCRKDAGKDAPLHTHGIRVWTKHTAHALVLGAQKPRRLSRTILFLKLKDAGTKLREVLGDLGRVEG